MTIAICISAALLEIAGCFSFWAWIKLEKSALWLAPGTIALWGFAYLLTQIESEYAGRAYAAYGAVYILSSILWMWTIEGNRPDQYDITGTLICCIGAAIILFSPRA